MNGPLEVTIEPLMEIAGSQMEELYVKITRSLQSRSSCSLETSQI
jgi:hypothetical protein